MPTRKRITVRINSAKYEDYDNCLSAAAADYVEEHGLADYGYAPTDLDARWDDEEERGAILLSVPVVDDA